MERKQSLEALLASIDAGTEFAKGLRSRVFGHTGNAKLCLDAYIGSLDAAKDLHDAVLPNYRARIDIGKRFRCWIISPSNAKMDAYSDSPARAWLIAIIKALIAKEQST